MSVCLFNQAHGKTTGKIELTHILHKGYLKCWLSNGHIFIPEIPNSFSVAAVLKICPPEHDVTHMHLYSGSCVQLSVNLDSGESCMLSMLLTS